MGMRGQYAFEARMRDLMRGLQHPSDGRGSYPISAIRRVIAVGADYLTETSAFLAETLGLLTVSRLIHAQGKTYFTER